MAEPRTTAKHRSAVTGWLSHSGNSTRLVRIGFATALVAAAVVLWSALGNPNDFAERTNWITHTQNVLEVLGVARADAFFGVAAMQEYYRTGDQKRLDGLPGDFFWLQHQLAALRTLTRDNPSQQRRVDELDRKVARLVTLGPLVTRLALTHSLARVAAEPEAAELSSGFGEVMRTLREMTAEEDQLMA
ncbi:MAG: CHASE3 domain-containing protein, partial [Candidatus Binataceae bacterium]